MINDSITRGYPREHIKGDGSFSIGSRVWPGLGKIVEETGELNVALGKLIATHGAYMYEWEERNLAREALEEGADSVAAILFFVRKNNLSASSFLKRIEQKLAKYEEWHANGDG